MRKSYKSRYDETVGHANECKISCRSALAFGCTIVGILLRTLAVLCTQQRCSFVSEKTLRR